MENTTTTNRPKGPASQYLIKAPYLPLTFWKMIIIITTTTTIIIIIVIITPMFVWHVLIQVIYSRQTSLILCQSHSLVTVTFQCSRNFDWTCSPQIICFRLFGIMQLCEGQVWTWSSTPFDSGRLFLGKIFPPSDIPFSLILLSLFGLIRWGGSRVEPTPSGTLVPDIPPCKL